MYFQLGNYVGGLNLHKGKQCYHAGSSPAKDGDTDIYESTGFSAAHIMYIIRALLDKYDIEWSDFAYSARSTKPSGKEEQ